MCPKGGEIWQKVIILKPLSDYQYGHRWIGSLRCDPMFVQPKFIVLVQLCVHQS